MASFACFRIIKITRACLLRSNCYPSFVSSTLLPLGSAKACHRGEKTQQHDWRMPTPTALCRTFDLLKPWEKLSENFDTISCVRSLHEWDFLIVHQRGNAASEEVGVLRCGWMREGENQRERAFLWSCREVSRKTNTLRKFRRKNRFPRELLSCWKCGVALLCGVGKTFRMFCSFSPLKACQCDDFLFVRGNARERESGKLSRTQAIFSRVRNHHHKSKEKAEGKFFTHRREKLKIKRKISFCHCEKEKKSSSQLSFP